MVEAQAKLDFSLPRNYQFDGETYSPKNDKARLSRQIDAVLAFMSDGKRHTLGEIASHARCEKQSASARLRDLRKKRFGSHDVRREYVGRGLWRYWLAG